MQDKLHDIRRILQLHHSKVTFSGGNIFMEWDENKQIIDMILLESPETEIHIVHNGETIHNEHLEYIDRNNIIVDLIAFGYDEESFCSVTGEQGAYQNFVSCLKQLTQSKILYNIIAIGTKEKIKKITKMKDINIKPVFECAVTSSNEIEGIASTFEERKKLAIDSTFMQKRDNRCLYGKIALTSISSSN